MQPIERSRSNLLALAAKWVLSSAAEHLDPSTIPPGGSGRPSNRRVALTASGIALAAGAATVVCRLPRPFTTPASPQFGEAKVTQPEQESLRVPLGTYRVLVETKRGVREALVVPPSASVTFSDRNHFRNETDFMELLVLTEPFAYLYGHYPPVLGLDSSNRYFTVTVPNPPGRSIRENQEHFISVGNIMQETEPIFSSYPPQKEDEDKFKRELTLTLNWEFIRRLRFPPEVIADPSRREEVTLFATRVLYALIDVFGVDGLPIQLRNFDHEKAAEQYARFQASRRGDPQVIKRP